MLGVKRGKYVMIHASEGLYIIPHQSYIVEILATCTRTRKSEKYFLASLFRVLGCYRIKAEIQKTNKKS